MQIPNKFIAQDEKIHNWGESTRGVRLKSDIIYIQGHPSISIDSNNVAFLISSLESFSTYDGPLLIINSRMKIQGLKAYIEGSLEGSNSIEKCFVLVIHWLRKNSSRWYMSFPLLFSATCRKLRVKLHLYLWEYRFALQRTIYRISTNFYQPYVLKMVHTP